MVGLPVIASGWSGQMDFLDAEKSMLIPGNLDKVPKSAHWKDIIVPESQWFTASENNVYQAFKHSVENIDSVKHRAIELMEINRKKFTLKNMSSELDKMMDKYVADMPQQVGIKLPKLKKVGGNVESQNTKIPELKLPKLKKVNSDAGVSV